MSPSDNIDLPDEDDETDDIDLSAVQMIPVERIRILNPRSRNPKGFSDLVDNIAAVGLKRPITVAEKNAGEEGPRYDLVCGQGRLEAFQSLGESHIPAIVRKASRKQCFIMSLVENVARRKHSNLYLLEAIRELEGRGYTVAQIAEKTNLDRTYIRGILHLLKAGEERLIAAVEKGLLPITLAMDISKSDDGELQNALTEAYESGTLKGDELLKVRRLVERRRFLGKRYGPWSTRGRERYSPKMLDKTYQEEVRRQKVLIRKAEINEQRLLFVTTAMKKLFGDEHFRTLLRAEGMDDLPEALATQLTDGAPS